MFGLHLRSPGGRPFTRDKPRTLISIKTDGARHTGRRTTIPERELPPHSRTDVAHLQAGGKIVKIESFQSASKTGRTFCAIKSSGAGAIGTRSQVRDGEVGCWKRLQPGA